MDETPHPFPICCSLNISSSSLWNHFSSSNGDGSTDPIVSSQNLVPLTRDSSSLMSDLPDGYVVHHFSRFE